MQKFLGLVISKVKIHNPFFIEMPFYQIPSLKTAFKQAFNKGKVFLKNAGTIIFTLSLIIWALSSYPKLDSSEKMHLSEEQVASLQLEKSVLGRIGKTIEPMLSPLGFDWKMGVGLLVAFGARELFVSALGTIYALGDVDENSRTLQDRLLSDSHFNMTTAISLLIFFVFACQCMSTLGIVRRETDSYKIPLLMFTYMTILAYAGAYLARVLLT
ncbi:MAG: nucleoside recognition domain-containing protein [Bacteriovoracaceae bacterium]